MEVPVNTEEKKCIGFNIDVEGNGLFEQILLSTISKEDFDNDLNEQGRRNIDKLLANQMFRILKKREEFGIQLPFFEGAISDMDKTVCEGDKLDSKEEEKRLLFDGYLRNFQKIHYYPIRPKDFKMKVEK